RLLDRVRFPLDLGAVGSAGGEEKGCRHCQGEAGVPSVAEGHGFGTPSSFCCVCARSRVRRLLCHSIRKSVARTRTARMSMIGLARIDARSCNHAWASSGSNSGAPTRPFVLQNKMPTPRISRPVMTDVV